MSAEPALAAPRVKRDLSEVYETIVVYGARFAIVAAILFGWQLYADQAVDSVLVGSPAGVIDRLATWTLDGTLSAATIATLRVVVFGLLFGGLAGIVFGLVTGVSRIAGWCFGPLLTTLFAMPKIALVPLFILWFGLGFGQRTVFTATVVFFLVQSAVHTGVRSIPPSLDNTLRLVGATLLQRVRVLYLPGCVGWILSSARVATPYAFLSAVGAEVISADQGFGNLIKISSFAIDPDGMFSAVIVLTAVAFAASTAVTTLDRVSRWRL